MMALAIAVAVAFAVLGWIVYRVLARPPGPDEAVLGRRFGRLLWILGGFGVLGVIVLLVLAFLDRAG